MRFIISLPTIETVAVDDIKKTSILKIETNGPKMKFRG